MTLKKSEKCIRYALGGLMDLGVKVLWAESPNNPMSTNFVSLTVRGEHARARWWALHARRKGPSRQGVFDDA